MRFFMFKDIYGHDLVISERSFISIKDFDEHSMKGVHNFVIEKGKSIIEYGCQGFPTYAILPKKAKDYFELLGGIK